MNIYEKQLGMIKKEAKRQAEESLIRDGAILIRTLTPSPGLLLHNRQIEYIHEIARIDDLYETAMGLFKQREQFKKDELERAKRFRADSTAGRDFLDYKDKA